MGIIWVSLLGLKLINLKKKMNWKLNRPSDDMSVSHNNDE